MLSPRPLLKCLKDAAVDTINHDGIEHAGYLAFLTLLAMFPFLVFLFAVIGFLGQGEAGTQFITAILQGLPENLIEGIKPRAVEIVSGPPQGLLTVSIIGAIWTASSAVEGTRTVLNRAYRVATPPAYWLRRSLSILQLLFFTFICIIGILLAVTLQLSLQHIGSTLGIDITPEQHNYVTRIIYFIALCVLFCAVSFIYFTIPNLRQRFISVAPGALVAVVGWLAATYSLTQYLSHFDQVNLIYGSLGSMIAVLVFFYICNIIFIFGAEFNFQVIQRLGIHIREREGGLEAGDVDS